MPEPLSLRQLAEEALEAQQTYHWALRDDPNQKEPYTCLWAGRVAETRDALFAALDAQEATLQRVRDLAEELSRKDGMTGCGDRDWDMGCAYSHASDLLKEALDGKDGPQ